MGRAAEDAAVDDGDEVAERARSALIGCGTQGVFLAGNGGRGIEYCRHAAPEGDRRDAVAEAEADQRQDAWRHGGQKDAPGAEASGQWRSEERRVGKEWGSTCRSRWARYH